MLSQSVIALSIAETPTGFFLPESVLAFYVFICFTYKKAKKTKKTTITTKIGKMITPKTRKRHDKDI